MRIRKNAGERRKEVLEETLRLAFQIGPDRITTEAIAKAVGVSQAAIFRHFPRKDDIWAAVVDWIRNQLTGRWLQTDILELSPEKRLRNVVRSQFQLIHANPGLPMILLSRELHTRNEFLRRAIRSIIDAFNRHLCAILEEGKTAGEFSPDLDVPRAASLIVAVVQGLALRWVLSDRSFDIVGEGERTLDLALRGIASREFPEAYAFSLRTD